MNGWFIRNSNNIHSLTTLNNNKNTNMSYMTQLHNVVELNLWTLFVTLALELASARVVVSQLPRRLYWKGWIMNWTNHFVVGVPAYVAAIYLFGDNNDTGKQQQFQFWRVLSLIVTHNVGYYFCHRTFHTIPKLYKYHKFHHSYVDYIPPSSANAVSVVEYILAYLLPFVLGCAILAPICELELQCAISVVSLCNVLVHTPLSYEIPTKWWVSAADHARHHCQLSVHFAAPCLNVDYLVERLQLLMSTVSSKKKEKSI
jgi:sterol desaturase/sphingolipid hydroxylase (fatty acid hydroxylase superfamily)